MNISKFIYSWMIFMLVWLGFTTSFQSSELITGGVISFVFSLIFANSFTNYGLKFFHPTKLFNILKYLVVFVIALIKSNIEVALIVLQKKLPINPGIVKFKTTLKSDIGKMILANSITLTPGTLTVDVIDDTFFIHWLTVESKDETVAYEKIAKQFETILKGIFE